MTTIVMTRGDTRTLTLTLTDAAGEPYDLTGADIRFSVGALFDKSLGDGISVADPPAGVAVIDVDPDDTTSAGPRRTYPYDVEVTFADGSIVTPILGRFVIRPDVSTPE